MSGNVNTPKRERQAQRDKHAESEREARQFAFSNAKQIIECRAAQAAGERQRRARV